MKTNGYSFTVRRFFACWVVSAALFATSAIHGAITNVIVSCTDVFCDAGFTPPDIQIQVNDQVQWTWGDANPHSSTSLAMPTPLWDSGTVQQQGFTFLHTFSSAGNFPYVCSFHGFTGSVTVQAAANVPPSVAINAPTNGAAFAAPWSGAIQASASDTDDTVNKVDFFANATLLGTVSNPPPSLSLPVSNLAAGSYTLKAVATDSRGATNASAGVVISVITPNPITLSSPRKTSATSFEFNYTADLGLNYIIQRAGDLLSWISVATNTAVSNPMPFTDNNATGGLDFYRVQVAPNP